MKFSKCLSGLECRFFFVESDSEDRTIDVLNKLKRENPSQIDFIALGHLTERLPLRTMRIAYCRNFYLDYLKILDALPEVVIVSDWDGCSLGVRRNDLLSSLQILKSTSEIGALFATQRLGYYDLWALRAPGWLSVDCFSLYSALRSKGLSGFPAWYRAIGRHLRFRVPGNGMRLLQVNSAFGGLGIYKTEVLLGVRGYLGAQSGKQVCEHVCLHKDIRARGFSLVIDRKLKNAFSNRHFFAMLGKGLKLLFVQNKDI